MLLIGRSSKKTRSKPEKEGKNGGELWALPPPEARKTHPERLIWLDLQGVHGPPRWESCRGRFRPVVAETGGRSSARVIWKNPRITWGISRSELSELLEL